MTRLPARHSTTGERFRLMEDAKLRKVMRRLYRMAADSPTDQRAAQAEMRRHKTEGTWTL